MALPLYLAMTAAEIQENSSLPAWFSYMACHFSPYGTGLSNLPAWLPEGTLLILNDRTPIHGHDFRQIGEELVTLVDTFQCSGVLLDFQRPSYEELHRLVEFLTGSLPCPTAVSAAYGAELSCPVFLPPAPLDIPLEDYLIPWKGREIWLEAALDAVGITLTSTGSSTSPCKPPTLGTPFVNSKLHCHYHTDIGSDFARFTLFRTREDLDALLAEAPHWGVTQAVGLWQELAQT